MQIVRELRLMADRPETTRADAAVLLRAAMLIEGNRAWGGHFMRSNDHAASAALMSARDSIGLEDE